MLFQAEFERDMIRVARRFARINHATLVDHARNKHELAGLDNPRKSADETVLCNLVWKPELTGLLADVSFVENDDVVAKLGEFERLKRWNDSPPVVGLLKDTEGQHEYGIGVVYRNHAVVAAFVDIDDVIAKPGLC